MQEVRFIADPKVQSLFIEKWDSSGTQEFARDPRSFPFIFLLCLGIYALWSVILLIIIPLRPFSTAAHNFLMKGRQMADSRYPWHMPIGRWVYYNMNTLIHIILIYFNIYKSDPYKFGFLDYLLLLWAAGAIADEALQAKFLGIGMYIRDLSNLIDLSTSLPFISYSILKMCFVYHFEGREEGLHYIQYAYYCVAITGFSLSLKALQFLELSSSLGPFLVIIKEVIIKDASKFLVLLMTVTAGFILAFGALEIGMCKGHPGADGLCSESGNGLGNQIKLFLSLILGSGSVDEFNQIAYVGFALFSIFGVLVVIILMNIFIAQISSTYNEVMLRSTQLFAYTRAKRIIMFGSFEPIYSPFSALNSACIMIGRAVDILLFFGLRSCLKMQGKSGKSQFQLRRHVPELRMDRYISDVPIFSWLKVRALRKPELQRVRNEVFRRFLSKARAAWGSAGDRELHMRMQTTDSAKARFG